MAAHKPGGGGSQLVIKQRSYFKINSIAPGSFVRAEWAATGVAPQFDLLDLTDPARPLVIDDGLYMLSGQVINGSGDQAGKYASVSVQLDDADDAIGGYETGDLVAVIDGAAFTVAASYYLVAGQRLICQIRHNAAGSLNFYCNIAVVFISGLDWQGHFGSGSLT
jgi:hypothetical protein